MMHYKILSFTKEGAALGDRLCGALGKDALTEHYARGVERGLQNTALSRVVQQAMYDCDGIIFIGAIGIAVRTIAPYLRGKAEDPAVIALDEAGRFVVPLLSGHLGGANALAVTLAARIGATPVLTTATDVRNVFAIDDWARRHGFLVLEPHEIRYFSAALLRGEPVGWRTDFPTVGALPEGLCTSGTQESGAVLSIRNDAKPFAHTIHLTPRIVVIGIGCRKGTLQAQLEAVMRFVFEQEKIPYQAVRAVASIDIKREEPGLLAFCRAHGWALQTFSAETLQQVAGAFTTSPFVQQQVGVDNVCERAAVCATENGSLFCRKYAKDGVTVALAQDNKEVHFP